EKQGFRDKGFNIVGSLKDAIGKEIGLREISLRPAKEETMPRWQCVEYTIIVNSPLHTADPIEALLHSGNYDSVVYKKTVVRNGNIKQIPVFKGETIRGIVRTAFARILRTENVEFDEEHEDCTCPLCQVFGNEHRAGRVRFEDLVIEGYTSEKKFDHVSIDRFTGGAAEKRKFDDLSLKGSPRRPIVLRGKVWIRNDMDSKGIEKLKQAFMDIRDGLYPLGSRGGIGYGWVTDLKIENTEVEEFRLDKVSTTEGSGPATEEFNFPSLPEIQLNKDAVYHPHYFIRPHEKVNREIRPVGHERFHDDLLTGRIKCTLKTLTPLIIPDTEDPDAFGLQAEHKGHQNFRFFR
ncbi:MAG: hypothetical protein D6778_09755, partial [Nitrospirae bacterium]